MKWNTWSSPKLEHEDVFIVTVRIENDESSYREEVRDSALRAALKRYGKKSAKLIGDPKGREIDGMTSYNYLYQAD